MVPGREGAGEGGITFFRESVRNDLRKHRISRRTGKTPDIPTERLDAPRRDDYSGFVARGASRGKRREAESTAVQP